MEKVHEEAERKPGRVESYWLSNRTLLVKRVGILVGIEKALIEEGYTETLKLVKRPLERTLLENVGLEKVLKRNILETFLDWNFGEDMGYIIFVLDSDSGSRK
ncbi:Na-translocating system protein MpsC family protein [Planomicrobium okeanokoites]|uniref:Na-translocating system protein MpsC family protein n=1 Tax=Planomicrobium okeanokoites TaxID=244 RepID=UPI0036090218